MAKDLDKPEPSLADVLARMVAIQEEQAAVHRKADERADREDLTTEEARKSGRSLGATGVYENRMPPEISDYNPLGERDNPRDELRCKMIWVGFKLTKAGLSKDEIALLNEVSNFPGEYRVTKADGSLIDFTVTAKTNRAGQTEAVTFHFPCKAVEDRQNHMPMTAYLREALEQARQRI
jgi:hypothetical protein